MSARADDLGTLAGLLRTERYGRVHEHYESIGSTNDRAMSWAREGAPDGALVTADAQTAGRGRHGRTWDSFDTKDLYASVVVRPTAVADLGALGLAVAVAVREALPNVPKLELKWPNDILVGRRKLAGILCETRWLGERPEIIVGFGINVGRTEFADGLREIGTSLALTMAPRAAPGRAALLASVLLALERVLAEFFAGGFASVRGRYEADLALLGREITLKMPSSTADVIAEALEDDGRLRVRPVGGGPSYAVSSADVSLGGE